MPVVIGQDPLFFYSYYRYHLPWPSAILIENTKGCNAQCVMCPRETLARQRGFMEFGLFEKSIREVSGAGQTPVVRLHGFGEPLLDGSLPERTRLAKACGIKHTCQRVGDLNSQSVMEIWNGPVLSAIRKRFGRLGCSGFPTCLSCDWVSRR
ncbi:MAG: SPASM domain-containing protein [Gemmatimonadota bacterium]